jgi:hypothetical protein
MQLSPLTYMGILALVLLLLYVIAIRLPLVGNALAFLCVVVARPLVTIQGMLEKAAAYCDDVVEKTLRYPPGITDDTWHGVLVIARNIILMVSSIILTADVYNTLQSLPLLFGGAGVVDLPGSFAIPSSLLFVCMSALYGSVVLECVSLLPYGAGLFPRMTERVKKWLGISCAFGFVLSLVFAVLFWVYRGWFLADPESAGVLAIPVFALVGFLVTGASVLALWGLVIGLTGLTTFVFWLLYCGFHFVASCFSFVPSLLDVLALHLSQGRMSVYGEFLGHEPYKPPASPFPASQPALSGQKVTALLPQNAAADVTADEANEIVPVETTITEVPMSELESASIVFVGRFGTQMFPLVRQKIAELHATTSFCASAYLDLPVHHIDTAIPGVVDYSPTPMKKNAAVIHGETEGQAIQSLFNDVCDQLVEVHQPSKGFPAPLLFLCDRRHLVDIIDGLESLHRRLSLHPLVVVTEVSEHDVQEKAVQVGLADVQSLVQADVIATIIVTSPHAPLAATHGGDTQRLFEAHTLVDLVVAQKHSLHNPSLTDVLKEFHTLSPFTTIASASEGIAMGQMPKRWSWVPGVKQQAGTGSYGDILAQTKVAIDRVVTEEDTRMFPAQVQTDVPSLILASVPVALNDIRHQALVRDNALYVASHYPFASSITVRGNGCSYPRSISRRFLVQASCLYPLQPASLLRLQEGRTTKVTPLFPVTALDVASSNGHVPTQDVKQPTKPSKTVATTRQKKATSSRRVVRKNTKQAK